MRYSLRYIATIALLALASGMHLCAQQAATTSVVPTTTQAMVLDRVLAIVNEDVILESDLQEEVRYNSFQSLPTAQKSDERAQAFSRLINRLLILQQIQPEDKKASEPTDDEFAASYDNFKSSLPACAHSQCDAPEQWEAVLHKAGFDADTIATRWRERMMILRFIELRFRQGITITPEEIKKEYDTVLLPEFKRRKVEVVPLPLISERIQENLLQRRMNSLLQEWLKSLREQGTLEVLDPDLRNAEDKDVDGEGAE